MCMLVQHDPQAVLSVLAVPTKEFAVVPAIMLMHGTSRPFLSPSTSQSEPVGALSQPRFHLSLPSLCMCIPPRLVVCADR
jgi:hypothetical protein